MALELYANLPSTAISSGGTDAPAPGTQQTWTAASSAGFPAVSSSATPPTQIHIADVAMNSEIISVINISGTTWTVIRGAEGTTPVAHAPGFTVYQVTTAGGYAQFRVTDWLNAVTMFGATGNGGTNDWAAIQAALLAYGTLSGATQGNGGVVYLPAGTYLITQPLIIPSGITLTGAGITATVIRLANGSNCDVIQWASYQSSVQAAILGVSASAIGNAFYSGVRGLRVHGDSFGTTVAGYHHGINITTNPLTTAAGSDPDFDPLPLIDDVLIEACTGDGFFHAGRSGALLSRVLSEYNNGNGFTPSFDTTMLDCLANSNGITGGYFNHGSDVGAGSKFYNNGTVNQWVSLTSYSPGNCVLSSGVLYFCILATSGSTAPGSDPAHWTALSATSPQSWGWDFYWDSNASEHSWAGMDSQEPTAGSYYLKGATGISITGVSNRPNFNQNNSTQNGTNPNSYACVTLDGATGCNVSLGYSGLNNANYAARIINGTTSCNISVTGDASLQAPVSADTVTSGNYLVINGVPALGQSSSAQSVSANGQTVSTAGLNVARVTASSPRTGTILQAGTVAGQQVWLINEGSATITFNTTPATANIAGAAGTIALAANTSAYLFVWDANTSLWYKTT